MVLGERTRIKRGIKKKKRKKKEYNKRWREKTKKGN